jgi:hypothetical protein
VWLQSHLGHTLLGVRFVLARSAALGAPAAAEAARPRLAVVGFQGEYDRSSLIDHSADALATVGMDGINLAARRE